MKAVHRGMVALLALLAAASGAFFLHGSLELFPTDEQQSEVRLVYGSAWVVFALLALVMSARLRRKAKQRPEMRS